MALPVLAEEDPSQIGMALERHAEHVVALALHPVGAAKEAGQRGTARRARGQARAQRHRHGHLELVEAGQDLQPLFLPVDRREEVEVPAAERVLDERGDLHPALALERHAHVAAGDDGRESEALLELRRRGGGGQRGHAGPAGAGRSPVFWKCATCSCSFSSPYISESGVGGQPGTYTSTGTTRSTPLTTW